MKGADAVLMHTWEKEAAAQARIIYYIYYIILYYICYMIYV